MAVSDPLVIVPARGGSSRLPKKNVRRLAGFSLLEWTFDCAQKAGFDRVMLSTDDEEIAAEASAIGYWVPFRRPAQLAESTTPTVPALLHALDWYRTQKGRDPDVVVLLQATSPFRPPELIKQALSRLDEDADIDGVLAVTKLHVPLGAVYRDDEGRLKRALDGSVDAAVYVPSGAVYVTRTAALRSEQTVVPKRCAWVLHGGVSAIDIDTPEDWALAEAIVASRLVSPPTVARKAFNA